MLKSTPDILHELLADIYNNISETGEHPAELTLGIIQKPGKPKGRVQKLHPITLLSMIRKVLAVRMKKRIVDKLDAEIPPSQAAYRAGRSTKEHEFEAKVLMEKAITSANYPIHLLMLDMSKAFDTVHQSMLMQELAKVLDPNKLHIINVLTKTQLKIRCRNEKNDAFETDTGVPQGDCVSTNLFTFYLVKALDSNKHGDHDYCRTIVKPPAHITNDYQYAYINDEINLNIKSVDDMSHISSNMRNIEYAKKTLPSKLSSWDLIMNEEKTEEFTIKRNGEETWKKYKLSESLLESEEDIKRRKVLAMNVMNLMKEIFFEDISIEVKVNSFNSYVSRVFLYEKLENTIDSFQRRLLRIVVLNVKWPNIANNDTDYAVTRQIPWSQVITRRELTWLVIFFIFQMTPLLRSHFNIPWGKRKSQEVDSELHASP